MILLAAIGAGAAGAHLMLARPGATQPAGPPGFDGSVLGMTIGEWRAVAPPPGVGPTAIPDCGPAVAAAAGVGRAATAQSSGTVCSYDTRLGDMVLLRSARLDDRYRVDDLSYHFASGRLREVDFTASVDAYNDITAWLTRDYGPPVTTVRDEVRTPLGRFQRVRQTWRAEGGVVSLTDPSDNPLQLAVRMSSAVN